MTFDDLPLLDYEKEIFSECGAWRNFLDLEDSISLDELIILYESSMERQHRVMKVMAAAMGADVSEPDQVKPITGRADLAKLPFNVGYETMVTDE